MPPALFIGRFQPFHLGHLDALKQVLAKEAEVILVIGSAEEDFTPINPFRARERFEMIMAATKKWKNRITIVPVRDINQHSIWVEHIKRLVPTFGRVYTGSPLTTQLFAEAKERVVQIEKNKLISATKIRALMTSGGEWEEFVPKEVATYLKKMNATKRLQKL